MTTKIFVIALPTMSSVVEKITDALDTAFNAESKSCKCCKLKRYEKKREDLTPPHFKVKNEFGNAPLPPWGIGGKEADENLRFGAGFEIDEPRCEDYSRRWEFESDHAAYDRFVEAGEDCVARGLEKKSDAPITKCKAVRKKLNEAPPMNLNLLGETHWWDEDVEPLWF